MRFAAKAMLEAAVQAIIVVWPMELRRRPFGGTILTSMDQKTMKEVGINGAPKLRVVKTGATLPKRLASMGSCLRCRKAERFAKLAAAEFLIVTPGVSPERFPKSKSKSEDQSRKATPTEAIRAGADFLVVGRPIIAAADPRAAAQSHRRRNRRRKVVPQF